MFKIPSATLVTLSGLVAACLLLIALTGENVSSSMDAFPTIAIPGIPATIPSVPAAPTIPAPAKPQPTATPSPQATPQQDAGPAERWLPESIPGLVRVTDVPSPTPAAVMDNLQENTLPTSTPVVTALPNVTSARDALQVTIERTSPSGWLIPGLIAGVGIIFFVFGIYSMIRRRK